jgi:hypothetical protein
VADRRHKRDTDARRKPRAAFVAGPLAVLATASAVTIGVLAANPATPNLLAEESAADLGSASTSPQRDEVLSRSVPRLASTSFQQQLERRAERAATERAVTNAEQRMWTTTVLNLWSDETAKATQLGVIESGKRVLVTGRTAADRVEIVLDGKSHWVTAGYLAEEKPVAAAAGLSMEPCPDGSVESGLTQDAVAVYRAVCNAFPQITSYGGWDDHGEHSSGRAIDIMTSDQALGDQISAFLLEHASELNLYDVIWWGQIWTSERSAEGWRAYGDHGSATANHFDHVHVATNG